MDHYPTIAGAFQDVIELISVSVDTIAEPLERAAEVCTEALLTERKILCCGNGPGAAVAEILTIGLLHRYEQERPALPATCLNADGAAMSAIAMTGAGGHEVYARQVRALGQPGDVLLGVAGPEANSSVIQAIRAAHDRHMVAVIISGGDCADISSLLIPEDVEIHVPATSAPRIIELQVMIAHGLCQLIDHSLFGTQEQ